MQIPILLVIQEYRLFGLINLIFAPINDGRFFERFNMYVTIYLMNDFKNKLNSEKLHRKLFNIAVSKTLNKEKAEDLVQETLMKALEKEHLFDGRYLDGWLIKILKNNFIDSTRLGTFHVRERSKDPTKKGQEVLTRVKRESSYGIVPPEASIIDESDQILIERDSEKCFKTLNEKEQEIITLNMESSYSEISLDLNIKEGTIRQIKSRGMDKFIKCMGWYNE